MPHVERDHVPRATLEQHLGEPAGRRPDVEREPSRRVDAEAVERRDELVGGATDVVVGARDLDGRRLGAP